MLIQPDDLSQKSPNLGAPEPDSNPINGTNDTAGVKITIPQSNDLKTGQSCLLWISLQPVSGGDAPDPSPGPIGQVNCGSDEGSFTIQNGTQNTVITTESGAFASAVKILREDPGSGFTNGPVYLFYSLYPGEYPVWTVSNTTQVDVNFP